jgi:hypothetical protein
MLRRHIVIEGYINRMDEVCIKRELRPEKLLEFNIKISKLYTCNFLQYRDVQEGVLNVTCVIYLYLHLFFSGIFLSD